MGKKNNRVFVACEILSGTILYDRSDRFSCSAGAEECKEDIENFIIEIRRKFENDDLNTLDCNFSPAMVGNDISYYQTTMYFKAYCSGREFQRTGPDGLRKDKYYTLDTEGLVRAWLDHLSDQIDYDNSGTNKKIHLFKLYRDVSIQFLDEDPFDGDCDPWSWERRRTRG